ncbi:MAG: putative signal transduction protein with EFhand domain [Planctomycetaceae bacterium]|nr:putative signal transduction protein with EFhand domain [Planctomycetaceae bacterium]
MKKRNGMVLILSCLMIVTSTSAFADGNKPGGKGQAGAQFQTGQRPGLSAEQKQQMIARFDQDGDGKLNQSELQAARSAFGGSRPDKGTMGGPNPEMMQKLLAKYDTDGDGQLSESEKQAARAAKGSFGGAGKGSFKGAAGKLGQKKPITKSPNGAAN